MLANISGAGRGGNFKFTVVSSSGDEHPEPTTVHRALLGHRDALEFACCVEGILAAAMGGGFLSGA
jgi:hypothetical protein